MSDIDNKTPTESIDEQDGSESPEGHVCKVIQFDGVLESYKERKAKWEKFINENTSFSLQESPFGFAKFLRTCTLADHVIVLLCNKKREGWNLVTMEEHGTLLNLEDIPEVLNFVWCKINNQ